MVHTSYCQFWSYVLKCRNQVLFFILLGLFLSSLIWALRPKVCYWANKTAFRRWMSCNSIGNFANMWRVLSHAAIGKPKKLSHVFALPQFTGMLIDSRYSLWSSGANGWIGNIWRSLWARTPNRGQSLQIPFGLLSNWKRIVFWNCEAQNHTENMPARCRILPQRYDMCLSKYSVQIISTQLVSRTVR